MKNTRILRFLQDAEKGLINNIPNDIPLAFTVYKEEAYRFGEYDSKNVNRSFKYCHVKRCIVCGTRHPIVHHHIFNQRNALRIGILNNRFLVKLCPNCHSLVHECGSSRRKDVEKAKVMTVEELKEEDRKFHEEMDELFEEKRNASIEKVIDQVKETLDAVKLNIDCVKKTTSDVKRMTRAEINDMLYDVNATLEFSSQWFTAIEECINEVKKTEECINDIKELRNRINEEVK